MNSKNNPYTAVPSVAILEWITGNPYNGTMFTIASILIFIFGLKENSHPINYYKVTFM